MLVGDPQLVMMKNAITKPVHESSQGNLFQVSTASFVLIFALVVALAVFITFSWRCRRHQHTMDNGLELTEDVEAHSTQPLVHAAGARIRRSTSLSSSDL